MFLSSINSLTPLDMRQSVPLFGLVLVEERCEITAFQNATFS